MSKVTTVSTLLAQPPPSHIDRSIILDEEGYFLSEGLRVSDPDYGLALLSELSIDQRGRAVTRFDQQWILVEAFDAPLVALQVLATKDGCGQIKCPYGYEAEFEFSTFKVDEWDRFHGRTLKGLPFVLSRSAQADLFNWVDSFTDDELVIQNITYKMPPHLQASPANSNVERSGHADGELVGNLGVNLGGNLGDENIAGKNAGKNVAAVDKASFWDERYQSQDTPWDLNGPSPALPAILPRLKLNSQRVAVLGCGTGNDAAYLAEQGHFVTAIDISAEAIARAKSRHPPNARLQYVQKDVFKLSAEHTKAYDLVFDHTCYCAIDPARRSELVALWRRLLADTGHLLGVFFSMDKPAGPPFGGTEWELRRRLERKFRTLYWTRLKNNASVRPGLEFLVYAEKLETF